MSVVKVAHVLKRMEKIDRNIQELFQIESTLPQNREYYEALYISIEKEINHLLDEKIKLVDLKIENPPESLKPENQSIEDEEPVPAYQHPFAVHATNAEKNVTTQNSSRTANKQAEEAIAKSKSSFVVSTVGAGDEESVAVDSATSVNEKEKINSSNIIAKTSVKDTDDESLSSLEEFARSLDAGSKVKSPDKEKESANTKEVKQVEKDKEGLSSTLKQSRQDILNSLSQIDY